MMLRNSPGPATARRMFAMLSIAWLAALGGCVGGERRDEFVPLRNVACRATPWRFGPREGQRITTEHYEIFTTIRDQRLLDSLPQALETTYAYFQHLVPVPGAPTERMPVYLFADREDWLRFTRQQYPHKAELLTRIRNGGYTEGNVAVIEYVAHQVTATILAHEAMHQYLYHCARQRVPAWLNEGLAVLCEGQRWDNRGLAAIDPWFNPNRRNALAEALLRQDTYPLSELLRINAGHVVGGPLRNISAYYAQLWALLLFLREGEDGKYAPDLDRLLAAVGRGELEAHVQAASIGAHDPPLEFGPALFHAFFGADIDAVDTEFHRFMRQRILAEKAPT